MKTTVTIIIITIVALFATPTFADGTSPARDSAVSKSIASYLQNNLKYPKLSNGEKPACCVWVEVEVQKDGSFKVVTINSENKEMKDAVTSQIENLHNNGKFSKYAGKKAFLKISFTLK